MISRLIRDHDRGTPERKRSDRMWKLLRRLIPGKPLKRAHYMWVQNARRAARSRQNAAEARNLQSALLMRLTPVRLKQLPSTFTPTKSGYIEHVHFEMPTPLAGRTAACLQRRQWGP